MGMIPSTFTQPKPTPLDTLKSGDCVTFCLEEKQKLNCKFMFMYIPYADNPEKEAEFDRKWVPGKSLRGAKKPTDNELAMCASDQLTPEQQKQCCTPCIYE